LEAIIIHSFIKNIFRIVIGADDEGRRVHEAVMRLLRSVPRAGSLLDIGCADGAKAMAYSELVGVAVDKVKGVEAQERYRVQAAEKFEVFPIDIERERLPFEDEAFDLIVCNQVLEHLKNIFLPLAEMDRMLKTGGYLLIGIPNLAALHNRFLLLFGLQPLCNVITGPHIRCFTHRAFREFLKTNLNFELAGAASAILYPLPYPLVDWLRRFFPGLAAYTFYLLRKKKHEPSACGWNLPSIGDTLLI